MDEKEKDKRIKFLEKKLKRAHTHIEYLEESVNKNLYLLKTVTEQKEVISKLNLKMIDKNSDLAKTLDENKNLVRILCHDLSNSLAIVTNASYYMTSKKIYANAEKNKKMWEKAFKACQSQKEIIDHVREIDALSTGKKNLQLESVDFDKIFEKGQFIFKDKLEEKSLSLTYNKLSSSISVLAESITLSHSVFNNLLSNAIKFSHPGKTITVTAKNIENKRVLITIRDYGIGIPQDILKSLFDGNKETSRPGTEGELGTGFGMPLIKAYMNKYSADINISTWEFDLHPENHGTEVSLIFKNADE